MDNRLIWIVFAVLLSVCVLFIIPGAKYYVSYAFSNGDVSGFGFVTVTDIAKFDPLTMRVLITNYTGYDRVIILNWERIA